MIFFLSVFWYKPFSMNSAYELQFPAIKEVWLRQQHYKSKWAWIHFLTVSLVSGEWGGLTQYLQIPQLPLKGISANRVDIPAEMNAIHSDEEKHKTSNKK